MSEFSLHSLHCFNAVVRSGSFQAAGEVLHRSHPAVFAAVAKLERQLDLELLDRSGYRVQLTDAGRSFYRKTQSALRELDALKTHASRLAMGEEGELRVVIGDFCPLPQALALLGDFFTQHPATSLNLHFEAVAGPVERLLDNQADLVLHRVDKHDPRLEWIDLAQVAFVPVAAPEFLPAQVTASPTPAALQDFAQCIIRDTATHTSSLEYFTIEGAPRCTVADHGMKKQVILQGLAWGHLPHFMIEHELGDGRLRSLSNPDLPGSTETLVAARRRDQPHGPVASRLWTALREQAPAWQQALGKLP